MCSSPPEPRSSPGGVGLLLSAGTLGRPPPRRSPAPAPTPGSTESWAGAPRTPRAPRASSPPAPPPSPRRPTPKPVAASPTPASTGATTGPGPQTAPHATVFVAAAPTDPAELDRLGDQLGADETALRD